MAHGVLKGPDNREFIMEKVKQFLTDTVQFFREVKVELQKVTFPTRQETIGSTLVVLVLTVLMGIYLGLSDWLLAKIVRVLLQIG
jgi:preprotein translocase subunit SecE